MFETKSCIIVTKRAYRKNGIQDPMRTQGTMRTEDPRRTKDLRRTQDLMRTTTL